MSNTCSCNCGVVYFGVIGRSVVECSVVEFSVVYCKQCIVVLCHAVAIVLAVAVVMSCRVLSWGVMFCTVVIVRYGSVSPILYKTIWPFRLNFVFHVQLN